ncbi:lyase family protein [Tropicimonas marinistellae]|uniref:lyase family protein n=1 Tax=Tropicimonas marinistellae TaxID=1739787 RepID=UPI00082C76CC|nr:lyase family protein [Tropicimonas marinistellae]
MLVSLGTSSIYEALFGDREIADLLSAERELAAMIVVERALARGQGRLGVIPADVASHIDAELDGFLPDPASLCAPTASAGVAVPGLLAAMRAQVSPAAAQWLHWGATSQDIVDTAMVLQARDCLDVLQERLSAIIDQLQSKSRQHADQVMAARTRGQVATPITFGLKIARWAQPLISAEAAIEALRAHALRVQFGGAAGANTAIAPHGPAVSAALAEELELAGAAPWHTDRGAVLELAGWLVSVITALEKIGKDLILLGRSEIGEVRAGAGGGSSTMPQKANPVGAEALVTLGRLAAHLHGGLMSSSAPAEERDGAVWALEWIILPQLFLACGSALRHAGALAETLTAVPEAMRRTLETHPGAMAEAASFALAGKYPRTEAQAIVRDALSSATGFAAALATRAPDIDWDRVLDPISVVPACRVESERILSSRR